MKLATNKQNLQGLNELEAAKLLEQYGLNELKAKPPKAILEIFTNQFKSPIVITLVVAALLSVIVGLLPGQDISISDLVLILVIVLISGLAGFFQDYKAERAIEELKKLSSPLAKVIRNGQTKQIQAKYLVPGDLVLLEAGDIVPADSKLEEAYNIELDESSFTGESATIKKTIQDTIFMHSFVNNGRAVAKVITTGMSTEIGKIATGLELDPNDTEQFQEEIKTLSKTLILIVSLIAIIMFVAGFLRYGLYQSLMLAIALAVAAIPEGLPAVITLTLAINANKMAKDKALVRKLGVVETLGSVNVICTDKTGTLTENNMTVTKLFINNQEINSEDAKPDQITKLLSCAVICNSASITIEDREKKYLGDQTEIALLQYAEKYNISKDDLTVQTPVLNEISFSSERKMMTVVTKHQSYSKGAPEVLLEKCKFIYLNGEIRELDEEQRDLILEANSKFANSALRVLGFAYKDFNHISFEDHKIHDFETELIWLGLQAMIDPPRKEAKQAIQECKSAGIRIVMITGDNPITAKAIANEIGIKSDGVLTGFRIENLNDNELKHELNKGVNIFARTNPFHKKRILEILQEENIVAMTGDGVNDALAIKKADVGIAMGLRGAEVTKSVSDLILLDDNFATIVLAIKQGRTIFDNLRKFINYLFTCNFAEVGVIFIATLALNLDEAILFPMHILWINLLTDGPPALALGIDPPNPGVMSKAPRAKNEAIIDKRLMAQTIVIGIKKVIILMASFLITLPMGLPMARTVLFTGFVLYEFVRIATIRYQEKLSIWSNPWLVAALITSLTLQLLVVYSSFADKLHIQALNIQAWSVLLIGVLVGYISAILLTKLLDLYFDTHSNVH